MRSNLLVCCYWKADAHIKHPRQEDPLSGVYPGTINEGGGRRKEQRQLKYVLSMTYYP